MCEVSLGAHMIRRACVIPSLVDVAYTGIDLVFWLDVLFIVAILVRRPL